MIRQSLAVVLGALIASACTGATTTTTTGSNGEGPGPCEPGPGCTIQAVSGGTAYRLECLPVPEALVDVDLPHGSGRPIKAIAGIASAQGIAVMWRDPEGCGQWVLALADGVSSGSAAAIREEIARGVERFGVTASPVPQGSGPE